MHEHLCFVFFFIYFFGQSRVGNVEGQLTKLGRKRKERKRKRRGGEKDDIKLHALSLLPNEKPALEGIYINVSREAKG